MSHRVRHATHTINFWAPLIVVALMLVAIFMGGYTVWRLNETVDRLDATVQQQRISTLDACASANIARIASVTNLRADIDNLEADIKALRRFGFTRQSNDEWLQSKLDAVDDKEQAIKGQLDSVGDLAVQPGSPVKDCNRAYPNQ